VAVIFGGVGALSATSAAVLGLTTVSAALAGTTAALSAGLLAMRRSALKAAKKKQVDNPAGSAKFVVMMLVVLAILAVAAPVLIRALDWHLAVDRGKHRLWPLRGIAISTTAVCATRR
jgi:hypothetical protein